MIYSTLLIILGLILCVLFTRSQTDGIYIVTILALYLCGCITFDETFSGLGSHPVVLLVFVNVCMCALREAGVFAWIVRHMPQRSKGSSIDLLFGMLPSSILSAFLFGSIVMPIMIDTLSSWGRRVSHQPSRLILPTCMAIQASSCCTMIGAPGNLIIATLYEEKNPCSLDLMEPCLIGCMILIATIVTSTIMVRLVGVCKTDFDDIQPDTPTVAKQQPSSFRTFFAAATFALAVILSADGLCDMVLTCGIAACVLVISGFCTMQQARQSIDVKTITIIACSAAIGIAMTKSGVSDYIARAIIYLGHGQYAYIIIVIALVCTIMTQFFNDSFVMTLMTPIGLSTAMLVHHDPLPFIMMILFSSTLSYCTPFGNPAAIIAQSRVGYTVSHFMKIGLPTTIVSFVVAVTAVLLLY